MVRSINLENFYDQEKIRNHLNKIKKILFFRVCGTGMGSSAILLKSLGYQIFGCDQDYYPPMSDYLRKNGIEDYSLSQVTDEYLQKFDLIVVGNSVPRNNPMAELIEKSGTPFTSFPVLLGEAVLKKFQVIGVSGTHGKTTTCFFLKQMLNFMGVNCGYLIGGILDDEPPASIGSGKENEFFVIEADEYDTAYFQKHSKFHHYNISHCITTSLEFDHGDIFNSIQDIKDQFEQLYKTMDQGYLVYNQDYIELKNLVEKLSGIKAVAYDSKQAHSLKKLSGEMNSFEFELFQGKKIQTNIFGPQNIENILSCMQLLNKLDFPQQKIIDSVLNLNLVKRRQEVRGGFKNSILIDDFAHHPTAIEKTIKSIKEKFSDYKVFTVYEPASATARSDIFQDKYCESFDHADEVILIDNKMDTTVKNGQNLDHQKLKSQIMVRQIPVEIIDNLADLVEVVRSKAEEKCVFLIMSNRTCLGIWESSFFCDEINK